MIKILTMVGLVMNLVATVFIYLGSKHLPWGMQSFKGETPQEKAFFALSARQTNIGLLLLFLGFLFQLFALILQ